MTQEEKMKALEEALFDMCGNYNDCNACPFDDENNLIIDKRIGVVTCGLIDCHGKFPYQPGWHIGSALDIGEYKPVSLPDNIANSIMQHFTRGE